MSDKPEALQRELESARRELAELRARLDRQEQAHRAAVEELEKNRKALLFMLEDFEAGRKKIEAAHHEWVAALDAVAEPIFVHDKDFRILRANRAYAQRAGLPVQEVIGRQYWEVFPKGGVPPHCMALLEEALSGGSRNIDEDEIVLPSGEIFLCHNFIVRNERGGYLFSVHVMDDITERKRMEHALLESEEKFRTITTAARDAIMMVDERGNLSFWSAAAETMFGYGEDEVLGKDLLAFLAPARFYEDYRKGFEQFKKTGAGAGAGAIIGKTIELTALSKGRVEFPIELSASAVKFQNKWNAIGIVRDITARKQAEAELLRSKELLSETSRLAKIGGWEFDPVTLKGTWTEEAARIHGMDPQEETSAEIGFSFYQGEHRKTIEHAVREAIDFGKSYDLELELVTRKGERKWVRTIGHAVKENGRVVRVYGSIQDITERKAAEAELLRFNRALKTLSSGNHTLVYASDETDLLHRMCEVMVESGGYRLAWVGYVWQDQNKSIKPVAERGEGKEYVEALNLSWDDVPRGRGPTGTAVRTGQTQVAHDIACDPRFAPWREAALKYGYASSIALPLRENGMTFGVLSLYAAEPNAFDDNEVALLEELAGDLAFGIVNLRTRNERDRAVEERLHYFNRLRASLEDSLQAIATTVEMRDLYTAGHQRRVAELATAIAEQMMLPQEQVHGIHLAAIVHDLGKIHIPAEVLSKPGRLNELEFSFIKIHPQAGFDILKGIDFPWPIAQIVLQHHERLDGSGYPQGLKGDAILLEARILAVADVVEAMSSHRPYRAGLGVEAALEEIVKNRGVFYDAQVVDACLSLFRDKNYVIRD